MAEHQGAYPAGTGQGRLRKSDYCRFGRDAASAHRGQHRFWQVRLYQCHYYLAALQIFTRPASFCYDRPEGSRTAAVQCFAAFGRPGGH